MDTNKKISQKADLIDKFKKSIEQISQSIFWKSIEKEELSLDDWENIVDYNSLAVKIRHTLYRQIMKKALSSHTLDNKHLVLMMIKLTSIADPEYYPENDDFTPYYDEIFNHELSTKELVTILLHTIHSFELFNLIEKDEKYIEIQEKLSYMITTNNPSFENLDILNEYGVFYLFQNIEDRLKKTNISIEEALRDASLGIIESNTDINEDNLIESIVKCAENPIKDLYLKFKELAEDQDGMDNALDDARSILNI